MFRFFKTKSQQERLQQQYEKLMEKAFHLSKTNRTAADEAYAQAEEVMNKLKAMPKED